MNTLIGITGGIGSGKSVVTRYLRNRGETVLCADEISRQVTEPGEPGAAAIMKAYGNAYFLPNGMIDRKKLSDFVFGNAERIAQLNRLLHPIIIKCIFDQAANCSYRVFIDAALMIQAGMHKKIDYLWLVVSDIETRIQRVMQRDKTPREKVIQRINSQMSDEEMSAFADEIIDNNGTLADLYKTLDELLKKPEYLR